MLMILCNSHCYDFCQCFRCMLLIYDPLVHVVNDATYINSKSNMVTSILFRNRDLHLHSPLSAYYGAPICYFFISFDVYLFCVWFLTHPLTRLLLIKLVLFYSLPSPSIKSCDLQFPILIWQFKNTVMMNVLVIESAFHPVEHEKNKKIGFTMILVKVLHKLMSDTYE